MGVEARAERVEPGIHPTDERVKPSIDVIESSIHAVEPGVGPRSEGVDACSKVEEYAE